MNIQKKLTVIGISATVFGLAGLAPNLYFRYQNQQVNTSSVQQIQAEPLPEPEKEVVSGTPKRLVIPSLSIDLKVAEGLYNPSTQEWTLSKNKAHFAELSMPVNDHGGNTLIYGHYRRGVFSSLHDIKPGAKVFVYTKNDYKFTYKYRENRVTDPTDTSLFNYRGKPILTLQTCEGIWMQNRQLFTLDLVKVEEV